jgi:hypothetical protein
MDKFYVYALLDERKPGDFSYETEDTVIDFNYEPFYIGKGTGSRLTIHEKLAKEQSNNNIKDNKIRKIWSEGKKVIKVKVLDQLNEEVALNLEIELIKKIKRKHEDGPLINLTEGGDGLKNPSPEVRQKISESQKNKIFSELTREKLKNNWISKLSRLERIRISRKVSIDEAQIINDEISQRAGNSRKGIPHSEEVRQRMSLQRKGVPKLPRTLQHKRNLSISLKGKFIGPNNPMFNKNFRDFRVQKYGIDVEKQLEQDRIDKMVNTTQSNKVLAQQLFPGVPYNVYMSAYASYSKGKSKEDALQEAIEENSKNNQKGKENKIKKDIDKFYDKLKNGTLNSYVKESYELSIFLLKIRKDKGIRDFKNEINDINLEFNKKLRVNRINELQRMIDFYGLKIEKDN